MGYGGITEVAKLTGMARSTIQRGLDDLNSSENFPSERSRRNGGGRKQLKEKDPTLLSDLESLVEHDSWGYPMSPLRWTSKSLRTLAKELQNMGYTVSHTVVGSLLKLLDYSLQGNCKTKEGDSHPDRDAQFRLINEEVKGAIAEHEPVISIDTKKKVVSSDGNLISMADSKNSILGRAQYI